MRLVLGRAPLSGFRAAAIDADLNDPLTDWVSTVARSPVTIRHELDETKIVSLVAELHESHDVVVIDTAGAASRATIFAIGCADLVLVPVAPPSADIVEAIKTVNLIKSASQMMRREVVARAVLTAVQPGTSIAEHIEKEIAKLACRFSGLGASARGVPGNVLHRNSADLWPRRILMLEVPRRSLGLRPEKRSRSKCAASCLNVPIWSDPALSPMVEAIARRIAGRNTDADALEDARRIAEAQVDLDRVRAYRRRMLIREIENPDYQPLGIRKLQALLLAKQARFSRGLDRPFVFAGTEEIAAPKPLGDEQKLAAILEDRAREFAALDRYERRALSRRKAAIRNFDAARALAGTQPAYEA